MPDDKQYLIDICNGFLIPIIKGNYPYHIECARSGQDFFDALVRTYDGLNFMIIINDGILDQIGAVVGMFNDKDIDGEIADIGDQLFGKVDLKTDLYNCIADCGILFVVLHELSHVLRKHLHFLLPYKAENGRYSYSELRAAKLSPTADETENVVKENFIKMAEFDADAHSVILMNSLSSELLAMLSENYENYFPKWRTEPDNTLHRQTANLIMLYGATVALTIIGTNPERSKEYPSPFARLINIFDAFTQEIYKENKILGPGEKGMVFLENSDRLKGLMDDYIFPNFLTAVDIANEVFRIVGYSENMHSQDQNYMHHLLKDFASLLINLYPSNLTTVEASEYNKLRICRPQFNAVFAEFLNL